MILTKKYLCYLLFDCSLLILTVTDLHLFRKVKLQCMPGVFLHLINCFESLDGTKDLTGNSSSSNSGLLEEKFSGYYLLARRE